MAIIKIYLLCAWQIEVIAMKTSLQVKVMKQRYFDEMHEEKFFQ
jgi:hypothetical protein